MDFTGRISASIGRDLHARLTAAAEADGLSLSQLVLKILAKDLGRSETSNQPERGRSAGDLEPTTAAGLLSRQPMASLVEAMDDSLPTSPITVTTLHALAIALRAKHPVDEPASRDVGRLANSARIRNLPTELIAALFELSVDLDPGNHLSRSGLGQQLYRSGNLARAAQELSRVASDNPSDNHALLSLGWSHLRLGLDRGDEALVELALGQLSAAFRRWIDSSGPGDRYRIKKQLDYLERHATEHPGAARVLQEMTAHARSRLASAGVDRPSLGPGGSPSSESLPDAGPPLPLPM